MAESVIPAYKTPLIPNHGETPGDANNRNSPSLWKDASTRQRLILLFIIYGQFSVFLCASTPSSFLTLEILRRGGQAIEASILLQLPLLMVAFSSITFGKYQIYMNSKYLLLCGLICISVGQAAFGLLEFAQNVNLLVGIGVVIRFLQGVGQGAYVVAALTIVCQEFTSHITQVFGLAESLLAIGYVSGPILGSLLYSIRTDILLPFVISSGFILPLIPVGYFLLNDYRIGSEGGGSRVFETIRKPAAVFVLGTVAVVNGGFGMANVLGNVYMTSRGFTTLQVGLGLLAIAVTYSVTAVMTGFVLSRGGCIVRRVVYCLGILGVLFYQLIFDPLQTMPLVYVGYTLCGFFSALTLISGFSELVHHTTYGGQFGQQSDFAMQSALSGAWNLAVGVGEFVCPLVGSQLYGTLSYRLIGVYFAVVGLVLFTLVAVIVYVCQDYRNKE